MFEVIDDNGVIHSGSPEEMQKAFNIMAGSDLYSKEEVLRYECEWKGDLKLVEVIASFR